MQFYCPPRKFQTRLYLVNNRQVESYVTSSFEGNLTPNPNAVRREVVYQIS